MISWKFEVTEDMVMSGFHASIPVVSFLFQVLQDLCMGYHVSVVFLLPSVLLNI